VAKTAIIFKTAPKKFQILTT